jgi:hypothetical protein
MNISRLAALRLIALTSLANAEKTEEPWTDPGRRIRGDAHRLGETMAGRKSNGEQRCNMKNAK